VNVIIKLIKTAHRQLQFEPHSQMTFVFVTLIDSESVISCELDEMESDQSVGHKHKQSAHTATSGKAPGANATYTHTHTHTHTDTDTHTRTHTHTRARARAPQKNASSLDRGNRPETRPVQTPVARGPVHSAWLDSFPVPEADLQHADGRPEAGSPR
jgi:hypothetical protein